MKKILMAIMALFVCAGMYAQKGEQAAGVHLNFGTTASSVGLGVKYQYGLTDALRIEPSLTYYFGGTGMFDVTANLHYLFDVHPQIKVYPLAGLGVDMCRYEWPDEHGDWSKDTDACFKFNLGGGAEYAINDRWSVGLELKFEIITGGYSQFVAGLGTTYKF